MDGHEGAPPRRPFVGRRAELEAVDEAVAAARRGEPGIVWIAGAAGMGKSALLASAIGRADGTTLINATGDEAEAALPYGIVDQLAAALPADLLAEHPLAGPDRAPGADPMVVGAELLAALGAVGGDEPLLVVVDDVQWADDLSVRTLVFVLRRLRHDHVVVLLGARTPDPGLLDGEPAVDPRWVRLLDATPGARRLPLTGLAPAELSELAAALGRPLGSTGAAGRLWARTHGHPLHARTLLEELDPEALAATTTDVLPAPRSLAAVVLVRLSRASAAGQALVVAASVLGEACSLADAAAVAGTAGADPVDDPVAALDEGVRVGLLAERGNRPVGAIGFVHPLLRAAVYGDQSPARRRALHRAAASLATGRAALTHRIAAAVGPDAELAGDLERLAVDVPAGATALDVADLLRAAAGVAVDLDDHDRLVFRAAEVLLAAGETGRAGALEDELTAARPGPVRDGLLGRLALLRGRPALARPLLDAAAQGNDPGPRAIATADLALLAVLDGRPAQAVELAGACFADPDNGPLVRQPAGFALILGLVALGRGDDARAVLELAGGPPEARTPLHADTLVVRGVLAAAADDDGEAARCLGEALRLARAGQPVRTATVAAGYLAMVRDRTGEVDGLEAVELAVASARDAGRGFAELMVRGYAAQMHALRGHQDRARAHLTVIADADSAWWGSTIVTAAAGALTALVDDDAAGMLRALAPVLHPDVLAIADAVGALAPRVLHVEALLRLARFAAASESLGALDVRLADRPPGHASIDAARLRGLLAEAAGDAAGARAAFEAGRVAVAAPLALARLETELGRHLVTAGERRTGVDLLRSARDRLAALGAIPFLAPCEELLHAAGLTPSPEEDALGLTPHEDAVVALVVRGLTNREVARELFVSPRTVAYHLSNVYAKLGVTSRAQLRDRMAVPAR
ncbi:AAA family ATPase [Actinomycetospora endophytica]|uniref:AAA family ATPase n=1 Tax=Actinomycetospora endophytica TaxID=2291215 RepID=A0ABS8P2M6_9PSEU|nr:LuxR family transcriptional regulator [Actinomycetospora endophytica]MCD2192483.1 AAA family ATPase [Actinomycetospora endophytica]